MATAIGLSARDAVRAAGEGSHQNLQVLIVEGRRDRLERLAAVVAGLGHGLIARETSPWSAGSKTDRERPDVALVGLGRPSEHALTLIAELSRAAICPVIAVLDVHDLESVHEAARRGVFACTVVGAPDELESAIDVAMQRYAEYDRLQGAFDRRATIEQAKGVLMARHAITPKAAFEMLRHHSQEHGRKVVEVAEAIVDSHLLLVRPG